MASDAATTPIQPSSASTATDAPATPVALSAAAIRKSRFRGPKPRSKPRRPRRRGGDLDDDDKSDISDDDSASASSVSARDDSDDVESGKLVRGTGKKARGGNAGQAAIAETKDADDTTTTAMTPTATATANVKKVYTEEETRKFLEKKAKMKEKQKAKKRERAEARKQEQEQGGDGSTKADAAPAAVEENQDGSKEEKGAGEALDHGKPDQPVASSSKAILAKKDQAKKAKGKPKAKNTDSVSCTPPTITGRADFQATDSSLAEAAEKLRLDEMTKGSTAKNNGDKKMAMADSIPSPHQSSSTPPTGPRTGGPKAIAQDPRSTPRSGGFWTHDSRNAPLDAAPLDAGFAGGRGSFRGRGGLRIRGRGGFAPPPTFARQDLELTEPAAKAETGEKTLEMDKLDMGPEQAPPVRATKEAKWGHEGFESMQAVSEFQANRMTIRGRGRGRGAFAPRGGLMSRQPLHNLPTPQHTPDSTGTALPPVSNTAPDRPSSLNHGKPVTPTEESSTQPAAESLIDASKITVKMPGAEAVDVARPAQTSAASATPDTASASSATQIRATAPAFVAPTASRPMRATPPAFVPAAFSDGTASPQPPLANGSENGSISSSGHLVPPHLAASATGLPATTPFMQANGHPPSYRSNGPRPFQPQRHYSQRSFQAQSYPSHTPPFYPQSYSPDLYQQSQQHHPSRHDSFGSQGGVMPDGRASPYPVYSNGTTYFAAPRGSKAQIKSPGPNAQATPSGDENGLVRYASIDQPIPSPYGQQPGMIEGPGGVYYPAQAPSQHHALHHHHHQQQQHQPYNPYAAGSGAYEQAAMGQWNGAGQMGYAMDGYEYGY